MKLDALKTTTNKKAVVKKNLELDDYFVELYGRDGFLDRFDLNISNWLKCVRLQGRKVPKVYFDLMFAQKKCVDLEQAFELLKSGISVEDLLDSINDKRSKEIEELKIQNDKLKSALRMVSNIHKTSGAILSKVAKSAE